MARCTICKTRIPLTRSIRILLSIRSIIQCKSCSTNLVLDFRKSIAVIFIFNFVSALWAMILYLAKVGWTVGIVLFSFWLIFGGILVSIFSIYKKR